MGKSSGSTQHMYGSGGRRRALRRARQWCTRDDSLMLPAHFIVWKGVCRVRWPSHHKHQALLCLMTVAICVGKGVVKADHFPHMCRSIACLTLDRDESAQLQLCRSRVQRSVACTYRLCNGSLPLYARWLILDNSGAVQSHVYMPLGRVCTFSSMR